MQATKAAVKAMVVNRIGDYGLMLGILFGYLMFHSFDYAVVFSLVPLYLSFPINVFGFQFTGLELMAFCMFIGVMGKSAQFGLHVWLPDAMEGPTPVSALIHAATMVTAGVFIIIRCSPLFTYATSTLALVTFFGALTAIFAGTVGAFQLDIKKIIAYSTCSQLGYMVLSAGLSLYGLAFFHLFNHAFFKALLFLGAGAVIHALSDAQDLRRMGGLIHILPWTYMAFFLGSLSLMGFPFFSGFYSKDMILEYLGIIYRADASFAGFLAFATVSFTSYYSVKLLYMVFYAEPQGFKRSYENVHESGWPMTIALIVLAILSIFSGVLFQDYFMGVGSNVFGTSIYSWFPYHPISIHGLPLLYKHLPLIFTVIGFYTYIILNYGYEEYIYRLSQRYNFIYAFFNKK